MQNPTDPDATHGIRLAHLSDPHLPPNGTVPFGAVLNKRLLSLLSWHVKRHRHHLADTLDRLVADMRAQGPDLIAVTGDLTNLGLPGEYRAARVWLETLGTPERVTVIPGNHDALVGGAWEEGAADWRPFWQGDDMADGGDDACAFPILRRRGPLALVGVSSAIATAPGLAAGEVGVDQMRRLAVLLRRTREAGLCRVLLIHHPPLDGTIQHRKRLRDAAALRAVLEYEGVELVLHGHSHRSHHQLLRTSAGPAAVIGVSSASSMHREPASYHLFDITPAGQGWEIGLTTRRLAAGQRMETSRCASLAVERAHAR